MTSNRLAAALRYAGNGWPVFVCKVQDKIPVFSGGFNTATTDRFKITNWFTQGPDFNLGVPTGKASGFFVLDIDGPEGEATLKKLEDTHGPLPQTAEVITGGGGRHVYFKYPTDGEIRNSAGKLGEGLDVRGDGGYVIVPPSVHKSGRRYEWSVDGGKRVVPAPAWLLVLIQQPADQHRAAPVGEWRDIAKGVREGQRNHALARLAGKLMRCRSLDPYMVLELCHAWNESRCAPPLSADEVTQTVNSIAGREIARRVKNG